MQNPFSREQINNYVLLYVGIVAIIALFYILNTFLNPIEVHEKKLFDSNITEESVVGKTIGESTPEKEEKNIIRLLDKAY